MVFCPPTQEQKIAASIKSGRANYQQLVVGWRCFDTFPKPERRPIWREIYPPIRSNGRNKKSCGVKSERAIGGWLVVL